MRDQLSDQWEIGSRPVSGQRQWAAAGDFLFASETWAGVLRHVGAETVFAWHRRQEFGLLVSVFRRARLRVGVLGFPVVGTPLDDCSTEQLVTTTHELAQLVGVRLLRVTQSRLHALDAQASSARPEVWISDLTNWSVDSRKRLRKDLAFARRALGDLRIQDGLDEPRAAFKLYAEVVGARGGTLHYTPAYFEELQKTGEASHLIRIMSAVSADGQTQAFAVMAIHGRIAYYLHGAADLKARQCGVSDLLLEALIGQAQTAGCRQFTLMASPWGQPGLVQYKQKWGDRLGLCSSFDVANGLLGQFGKLATTFQTRADRAAARAWSQQHLAASE